MNEVHQKTKIRKQKEDNKESRAGGQIVEIDGGR